MKTLTIAFPAKFQIHARFAMTLLEVVDALRTCQNEWTIKTKYLLGKSNLSHARSVLVTEWYETAEDEDGFFFIDTDHTFTADDVLRVVGLEGDLNAGIYCNRAKEPTCFPLDGGFSNQAENIRLKYAATGFLFFRKKALVRIHTWMKETEGLDRVMISDFKDHIESRVIPFFHAVLEPPRESDGKRFWLGEDYSFSYRAIQAGLTIRGCISHTLGHEIPYVMFNDKQRRAPVLWTQNTISVYCGNTAPDTALLVECSLLTTKGYQVVLFSNTATPSTNPSLHMTRYEEFVPVDQFHRLILWGSDHLSLLPQIHKLEHTYIVLTTQALLIPTLIYKVAKVLLPEESMRSIYTSLLPPEKLSCSSISTLF